MSVAVLLLDVEASRASLLMYTLNHLTRRPRYFGLIVLQMEHCPGQRAASGDTQILMKEKVGEA